jgi:hypothetical protein
MGYTSGPGGVLRKRLEAGREGINFTETHAFFITDIEHFVLEAWVRAKLSRLDDLAAKLLRDGLDWEHFEALMPDDPDERTAENITELDRLAQATEELAAEVDVRTGLVDRQGRPFPPIREDIGSTFGR